mgnify:CR=1 FL=1
MWLKFGGIEGFVITSAIDPGALPDPLAKTVARSADGWWINYGKQPMLWTLPALGIAHALYQKIVYDPHYGLSLARKFHYNKPMTILDVPLEITLRRERIKVAHG